MNRRGRRGFTLVEVLMVMFIIGMTTAITIPFVVHSLRGNRLRTAARTVVMAGRYARSMALLKQQQIVVVFDIDNATISVEPRYALPPATDTPTETGVTARAESSAADDGSTNSAPPSSPGESVALTRVLDGVRIDFVEVGNKAQHETEGSVKIIYNTNGRCSPYKVRVVDEQGKAVLTSVDALSTAKTQQQQD